MEQKNELATFAGGCFWCTEAIFRRLKGVISVEPGYSGGKLENPTFEKVHLESSGHAEAIQIEFNPKIISYDKLLDIFWHSHNPTTLNRQGNDVGMEYRSIIFFHDQTQKEKALKSKKYIQKSNLYKDQIITQIIPFDKFYPAESEHKNFAEKNPNSPYCTLVIDPKIQKLLKEYRSDVKDEYLK